MLYGMATIGSSFLWNILSLAVCLVKFGIDICSISCSILLYLLPSIVSFVIQVSKHLRRIWTAAFRAMDDINETVRNSGGSLCRAVSSLTIRLCDVSLTAVSDASETLNIVLPFLLVEGIVSKVSSIQKASISMVIKLAKVSALFY